MPAPPVEPREGGARERFAGIQRARVLSALVEVCAERGAARLTVSEIVGRAGISRRTFYELFEGCGQALLAALQDATSMAAARVLGAYDPHARWRERIRDGLAALLAFLDDEPQLGRLLILESPAAGSRAQEHRARVLGAIVAAVDEGRGEAKAGATLPPLMAEGIVGGVLAVIGARIGAAEKAGADGSPIRGRRGPRMQELLNPLMSMIVLPYLGAAAARRELERPVNAPRAASSMSKQLARLDMRVTYRTMRVLTAIQAQPGSSNRQIGRAAGIDDQGQVSKLLARLGRLELIENAGESGKGAPNAWRLTPSGREFQATIELHSGPSEGEGYTGQSVISAL